MITFRNKTIRLLGLALAFTSLLSCNKEFEDIGTGTTMPPPNQPTIGAQIETDANFSILRAAATKAGMLNLLKQTGGSYTVFAPDNAAFIASGIPAAAIAALPAAQLQAILSYHIIPRGLASGDIPTTFPNIQMPTLLTLSPPFVKMPIFPSKRGNQLFANNIPVTQADLGASNGVIHKVARVVAPPSTLLVQELAKDPDLSFLRAAIARADEGQTGLARFDSLTRLGVANLTIFAPTNQAFRDLLTAMGLPASEATFAALPVQTVRGIVAYHLLTVRAFAVNLPMTTGTIQTALGAAPMPQLTVDRSTAAPRLLGAGNMGQFSNFVSTDLHAVNGVIHKIDRVLLPQ